MALWNEKPTSTPAPTARKEPLTPVPAGAAPSAAPPAMERQPIDRIASDAPLAAPPRRPAPAPAARSEGGESVIAANLTIEGKIEGSGNVRMAGRFKGDVRIDGNFNIDPGAHLTGQVLAAVVVVGGELQGNIESAKRVDVLEGGVIVGDVKAGSITVAAGSRMRGHVEFGWDDEKKLKLPGTAAGS
ncbi:MAG TPA: polymer-forming cytoskeletal protein [Steroidobacteraceae bacterium]|nr:polymer-forming cytoskeletal protein [Steroidobacteraceae bacterium]